MPTRVAKQEDELTPIAHELCTLLRAHEGGAVLLLEGDLGAGKTALTKVLARTLGITEQVTSPTFVIMKSYPIPHDERFTSLMHIDAYRIEDESELRVLGVPELMRDPHRLTVIEWPERVPGIVGTDSLRVSITIGESNERIISYGE